MKKKIQVDFQHPCSSPVYPIEVLQKQEQIVLERSADWKLTLAEFTRVTDGDDRWLFARGRPLRMIICKKQAPPENHLQEANNNNIILS